MTTSAALRAHDLRLALPGADAPLPVLAGVDLVLAPGEIVALVGPSGCGKSTLLSVLSGLTAPDEGVVEVGAPPEPVRVGALTLMPQGDALMPWRTVLGNVRVGLEAAGVERADTDRAARRAVSQVGLAGFEEHYPHALSGGMRQRVALARTLVAGSDVWLLDEPFGAVDAMMRQDLGELFERVVAGRAAVVLVTHAVDEAIRLADRVVVLAPRPTRVRAVIDVPLPRPRGRDVMARPEFAELVGDVMAALSAPVSA